MAALNDLMVADNVWIIGEKVEMYRKDENLTIQEFIEEMDFDALDLDDMSPVGQQDLFWALGYLVAISQAYDMSAWEVYKEALKDEGERC